MKANFLFSIRFVIVMYVYDLLARVLALILGLANISKIKNQSK